MFCCYSWYEIILELEENNLFFQNTCKEAYNVSKASIYELLSELGLVSQIKYMEEIILE